MELPNNKRLNLNTFDTNDTIRNKVAVLYGVAPKFLNKFKIPSTPDGWKESKIYTIIDTLEDFQKDNRHVTFDKFYTTNVNKFGDITPQEWVDIWIKYYIQEVTEGDRQLYNIFESELKDNLDKLKIEYPSEFSGIHTRGSDIKVQVSEKLVKKIEKFDQQVAQFENIKTTSTTLFEQKKQYITITIDTELMHYPLEYFFDKIILNETVPIAIYNEYCKIHKTFVLNGNIPIYQDNIVLLYKKSQLEYIDNEEEEEDEEEDDIKKDESRIMWYKLYNVITIHRDETESIVLQMDIENNINVDSIVDNIKNVLNWEVNISTFVTTNKISGVFYVLNQIIDPVITKEILLTPVLRNVLYSNDNLISFESNVATTTKYRYKNIIHYLDPITKTRFICHIATRGAQRKDAVQFGIKIGEPITVFKIIRGANIGVINYFQNIIGKMVTIYNEHLSNITKFYSEFVTGVNTRVFTTKTETLTELLPTIFPEQYSRLCAKHKIPHLIDNDDYDTNNPAQLEFPKDDDGMYYECDTMGDYPFIGLVSNKLTNKAEYPFLPCCFKQNQKENMDSNYQKYYSSDSTTVTTAQQSKKEYERILQTQKFAKFGVYGVLPENITKLFHILDQGNEYYRRGVHFQNGILAKSSFLECVLDALNWNNILQYTHESAREKIITEERNSIANFIANSGLCKQECYNLTLSEIENGIRNTHHYLSPALYLRAVEEFYNVNIFIFQRDDRWNKGNLVLPNHDPQCNYLFTPLKLRQTVFIYEHTGGIWDKNYSCELVIRFNPRTLKTVTLFGHDDPIVTSIYKQRLQMYPNFQSNRLLVPSDPPGIKNITSQYIDSRGKTRCLIYSNPSAIVYCQPTPPLHVPVEKEPPNIQNVNGVITKYNLTKKGGSDTIFITENEFEIYTTMSILHQDDTSSFLYNKRVSIHLLEYLLYLYSRYQSHNTTTTKTSESVSKFLEKHTIVSNTQQQIEYNINFMVNSNPQIIEIDSTEMRSKLNYMIRVHLLNNRRMIADYHHQDYLNNYYNTLLDFKQHTHQELVSTKLLSISNDIELLVFPPTYFKDQIFYFRHGGINYLAQPTQSLDEALLRVYNWYTKHTNTTKLIVDLPTFPFTCIPYSNKQYGIPIKVTGGTSIGDVYILYVYTQQQQQTFEYFVALLNK